ncbi:SDR family oxidoreductase [Roseococcus microcysteis]|uniref:SDR family oxidoreductase n=1 Tax=Roseococcus microcysteis TaxID=2771361 RepID=UPI00168B15EE|nr:SDR family oxidoreductase [Roseococcus microcysteis]
MSPSPRTIVITGASSGIGRATAHAFAAAGFHIVLAARRQAALEAAAEECRALGAEALAHAADVTEEASVEALADAAMARFGRVDVWFNNAGVGAFGRLDAIPTREWKRVVETNLFGCMHGARAALRIFRAQGGGVLIQNASIVGQTAKPDGTPYAASKFAIRGFSEALRQEVLDEPGLHVCTVLPSVIDTPFFQHAANHTGRAIRAAPPVYPAEEVARAVLALAERPVAEVVVGGFGQMAVAQAALAASGLAPRLHSLANGRALHRGFLEDAAAPESEGSLFSPAADNLTVSGGWRETPEAAAAATLADAAALPLLLAAWPFRLLDASLAPLLRAASTGSGPQSR